MHIVLFEDHLVPNFLPLVYFRPVYDLRCGARTTAERIAARFPSARLSFHVRRILHDVVALEKRDSEVNVQPPGDAWFVNGRVVADRRLWELIRKVPSGRRVFLSGGQVAAAFMPKKDPANFALQCAGELFTPDDFAGWPSELSGVDLHSYPWDVVRHAADGITVDAGLAQPKKRVAGTIYPGAILLNRKRIFLGKGSVVRPGAVIDAEKGPVIIGSGVVVMPNAVIEGPAAIGDNSIIKIGAKIYHGTAIGPWCKVGGEVEASVIQSHSNKQHDGFLGHSFLGAWVNLGADTNTSDLKNTYGNVKVYVGGRLVDSGQQFVGLTMGDHSKTGINMMFDTGSVVGISCNLFGAGLPPKFLPSFSWGEKGAFQPYDPDKSVSTARTVMARRNVEMSEAYERLLKTLYRDTRDERSLAGMS